MAKKLGNDHQLWVESATAGTFNTILGQGDLSVPRKSNPIDVSDKNSGGYGLTAAGNFDVRISLSGIPDLPDTTGLNRVDTQFKARNSNKFQIRKSPFAVGDVVFEGLCNILDCSIEHPKDAASSYSIELGLAAAPVTDTLFS